MSQNDPRAAAWNNGELRSLHYYNWMLLEEKAVSVVLVLTMLGVCVLLWRATGNPFVILIALALMLLTIWRTLVPVHFEINANGIARWNFGRQRLIPWEEIKSYEIVKNGVLLLPNKEHYPLEPFHAVFIPVPEELDAELRYRLRFFVDKTVE